MSTCDKLTGTLTLGATMSGSLHVAKGDKGDKGDAYIITEADKQEIKESLSGDISELKGDLTNWTRLDGVTVKDGTNIIPFATQSKDGSNYSVNGTIYTNDDTDYHWYEIPISSGKYFTDNPFRWAYSVDSSGTVVDENYNGGSEFIVSHGATKLIVTYKQVQYNSFAIAKNSIPTDTEYYIPNNVHISEKITSDMIDGYKKGNLFKDAELLETGKYISLTSGHIVLMVNDNYNAYVIKVDGSSKYTSNYPMRFVLPLSEDMYNATSSELLDNISQIDLSNYPNTEYLAFSFDKTLYSIDDFVISEGIVAKVNDTHPEWVGVDELKKEVKAIGFVKNGSVFKESALSNGISIVLNDARNNLRKGMRLVFEATVTSGNEFEIGFSISENSVYLSHNVITFDSTNITYNSVDYAHGLIIEGNVSVICEHNYDATMDITLLANGNIFKKTIPFVMTSVSVPYVKSNGVNTSYSKFTFTCVDFGKNIWMFGDSYFAYASDRWTYYLHEYNYDKNALIDGWAGMSSINGVRAFIKYLYYAKPRYAVWFMGMNDGTDTDDTTPNADWATDRDTFIALCEANGVEPIFATIPNVPSINHKGKNKWIRDSGYRYIDMCHAVGADVDVSWYGNMLSSDKIHPSESGAKALFAQVLLDLPEVMLDNL